MTNTPDSNTKTTPTAEHTEIDQELNFDDSVIKKIVGLTSASVDGVYALEGGLIANVADKFRKDADPTKGVDVDVDDDHSVAIKLDATLKYGESAPAIFDKLTTAIRTRLTDMTGLTVSAITMTVKDMLTEDEIKQNEADDADSQHQETAEA